MKTQAEIYAQYEKDSSEMWDQCQAHGKGQDPMNIRSAYEACMRGYGYQTKEYTWAGDYVTVVLLNGTPIYGSFKAWNMKGEEDLQTGIAKEFGSNWYAYIHHVANSDVSFQFRKKDES